MNLSEDIVNNVQQAKLKKSIGFFERNLTLWVIMCITSGTILGYLVGDDMEIISNINIDVINIPVAVLVWFMIYPMMVQIDFTSLKKINRVEEGLFLTLIVNWLIKPFSMAFFAWIFFEGVFSAFLTPERAQEYLAGAILLGAAPCTAMVFVWSYLTNGNPLYTLIQVSVNDLILLVAFVPIVRFLLGISNIVITYDTLVYAVVLFVAIPLAAGVLSNLLLRKWKGEIWFNNVFLKKLKPLSVTALLMTLVLLFAFQGKIILANPFDILIIAVPLTIQTLVIFFIAWTGGKLLKLPHNINAPAAMIGASNFFELSVAVAIAVFGLHSGAALATVVGVLIEVPIKLALVRLANRWIY
ncbi:MAG: ACR3 family arsenite efflux transporter [Cytophagaceae bacterium]